MSEFNRIVIQSTYLHTKHKRFQRRHRTVFRCFCQNIDKKSIFNSFSQPISTKIIFIYLLPNVNVGMFQTNEDSINKKIVNRLVFENEL